MRRSVAVILNYPSMHIEHLLERLGQAFDVTVYFYDKEMEVRRQSQGWSAIISTNFTVVELNMLQLKKHDFAICCGLKALIYLKKNRCKNFFKSIIYLAEPPIFYNNFTYLIKSIWYILIFHVYAKGYISKIFAIGSLGKLFYSRIILLYSKS